MSVNGLVGEEGNLIFNSEWDREPVKRFQDGFVDKGAEGVGVVLR